MTVQKVSVEIKNRTFSNYTLANAFKIIDRFYSNKVKFDFFQAKTFLTVKTMRFSQQGGHLADLIFADEAFLIGQEVTVSEEFAGAMVRDTMLITKVNESEENITMEFTSRISKLKGNLSFGNSASLTNAMTALTTSILFKDLLSPVPTGNETLLIKIEKEFMTCRKTGDNALAVIARGQENSIIDAHPVQSKVSFVRKFSGTPIQVLKAILTENNILVDTASFTAAESELTMTGHFYFYDQEDVLTAIDRILLTPFGLRIFQEAGKVFVVSLYHKHKLGNKIISSSQIVNRSPRIRMVNRKVFNTISFKWDFDESAERYREEVVESDAGSVSLYGAKFLSMGVKGVTNSQSNRNAIQALARNCLNLLRVPNIELSFSTIQDLANIGDVVTLTPQYVGIPDILAIVLSKTHNISTGRFSYFVRSFTNIDKIYTFSYNLFPTESGTLWNTVNIPYASRLSAGMKFAVRERVPVQTSFRLADQQVHNWQIVGTAKVESILGSEITFREESDPGGATYSPATNALFAPGKKRRLDLALYTANNESNITLRNKIFAFFGRGNFS